MVRPCLTPARVIALEAAGVSPATWAAVIVASSFALALVFAGVAAVLMWRRSSDPMALFAAITLLLFGGLTWPNFAQAVVELYPQLQAPLGVLNFLGGACFSVFLYVFPDGRLVPRWTRWTLAIWLGGQAIDHLTRPPSPSVADPCRC